jgi:hypothetical protein
MTKFDLKERKYVIKRFPSNVRNEESPTFKMKRIEMINKQAYAEQ